VGSLTDQEVAARAARAAGEVALRHLGSDLQVEVKSAVPTDVVTVADRAAEAAAVAVLADHRPDDGVFGEEGSDHAGTSGRRWIIDAIDGTLNFAHGTPGWCAAVVLVDTAGGPLASAVLDPERDELFSAARGEGAWLNGRPLAVRAAVPLDQALVAVHWGFGKLSLPGVRTVVDHIVDRVGALRVPGSGTLELCWTAAGRLHGWMQPDAKAWDWLPGALVVREAGGVAIDVTDGVPVRWSLGGAAETVEALRALLV
jgi:myo-inositol-1(or 4)-monophosphatase